MVASFDRQARQSLMLAVLLASLLPFAPLPARAAPVQARPASVIMKMVGVQTHIGWPSTLYLKRFPEVKAILTELGVRQIRDRLGSPASHQRFRNLWLTRGIKLLAVADTRTGVEAGQRLDPDGIPFLLAGANRIGSEAIVGLEGPNEANQMEAWHRYMGWPEDLRAYMTRLFGDVQASPSLMARPVLVPGLAQPAKEYWYDRLGNYTDISNGTNGHVYGTFLSLSEKLDVVMPIIDRPNPGSPLWITEFGWQTAEFSGGLWVDENTKVKYLARGILELPLRPQIAKGFIYQLIDHLDDPDQLERAAHFGLIDYNFNRKPSFYAVRNMLHVLCDGPLTFVPRSLDYTLAGDLTDVRTLLLQKNNGAFYLVLWLETQGFRAASGPVAIPSRPVSLSFAEPAGQVRMFRPADPGSDLRQSRTARDILRGTRAMALQVPDDPLVLEIVPRDVPPPPAPSDCRPTPS
jgi:hypothetical protein